MQENNTFKCIFSESGGKIIAIEDTVRFLEIKFFYLLYMSLNNETTLAANFKIFRD
jgi:hypothetical protein